MTDQIARRVLERRIAKIFINKSKTPDENKIFCYDPTK
jgi:hypothetical protein